MLFLNLPITGELRTIDRLAQDVIDQLNGVAKKTKLDLSMSGVAE
jgi:hypothetical protein